MQLCWLKWSWTWQQRTLLRWPTPSRFVDEFSRTAADQLAATQMFDVVYTAPGATRATSLQFDCCASISLGICRILLNFIVLVIHLKRWQGLCNKAYKILASCHLALSQPAQCIFHEPSTFLFADNGWVPPLLRTSQSALLVVLLLHDCTKGSLSHR